MGQFAQGVQLHMVNLASQTDPGVLVEDSARAVPADNQLTITEAFAAALFVLPLD